MSFPPLPPATGTRPGKPCNCLHVTATGSIPMSTCMRCFGSGVTDPRRDATLKRNRELRIPTQDEVLAFDGAHCKHLYANLAPEWRCPGCGRARHQLLRWTMLYPNSPHRRMGWAAGLHEHHDHGGGSGRFPRTIVCEQCNSADAAAKRELKLPKLFSFSPAEIRQFVFATPHGWHLIDYAAAQRIYSTIAVPEPLIPFWPPRAPL